MRWSDIPRDPSARILRQFAAMWLVFFLFISWWQGFARDRATLGIILASVAVVGGVAGLIKPSLLRWIFITWMVLVFPIGFLVSQVILGVVYYLLFTPIGLIFRLRGRDPLRLKREPDAPSYWQVKPTVTDVRSYFRQF